MDLTCSGSVDIAYDGIRLKLNMETFNYGDDRNNSGIGNEGL